MFHLCRTCFAVLVTSIGSFSTSLVAGPTFADEKIDALEGVGITEYLDKQIPLDLTFLDDDGNEVGGCNVSTNDWDMMGLTSYNARNKTGCLFGYKLNSAGVCEAPIRGYANRASILRKYGIDHWEPVNSSNANCNYNKSVIGELQPAQFKEWAKLMSDRDCPGVPVGGNVPGAPISPRNFFGGRPFSVSSFSIK